MHVEQTVPGLGPTRSLCGTCKRGVDAVVEARDGAVWIRKTCPVHGAEEALVASSLAWWRDAMSFAARTPARERPEAKRAVSTEGCPFDCGPCTAHEQRVKLPVVPITSACNLDCPICYTVNKNDDPHRMTVEHFDGILARLKACGDDLDIVNLTGGEPTLHPRLVELVAHARDAGIRRVTLSTNGIKLLDEDLVRQLAALGARVILSLDTLSPDTDRALLGANTVAAKLRVLDLLEKHEVATTILPAIAAGYNDGEVGALLDVVLSRPHVLSLELHPMTFTGQGGSSFDRRARITTPDLHARLAAATGGRIVASDFVPSPLAHPTCYSICYLLLLDPSAGERSEPGGIDGGYVSLARLVGRARLYDLLGDSLYLEPRARVEQLFRDLVDELWSEPERVPESERVLATVKRLLGAMFPSGREPSFVERQRLAERALKAVYIHMHMDEETFDTQRVKLCPVGVPEPDGSNTPTCTYNVVYRERDPRFADPAMLARMSSRRPAALRVLP